MKIWVVDERYGSGQNPALLYRQQNPERIKEKALYALRQRDIYREWPRLSIVKDRAPNYGLTGKPCGLFFAWRDLVVWMANVDFISRLCPWRFR
jgi:hypothetical protein